MAFTENSLTQNSKEYSRPSKKRASIYSGAVFMIRFYQYTLSYFLGGNCRFYPSCSDYAVESFEEHNFIRALYLTTKRILKCHPLSGHQGYDPVPTAHAGRSS